MRFLKRLMSKRNKAGFTLVEIVISVGLLGILLLGMTIFVGPILRAAGDTKKDIRASILAETLNSYISRSVMNAQYIAVFDGVAITGAQRDNDLQTISNSQALKEFKDFFNADTSLTYEVRCIGINWDMDDRTNEAKFMLTMNKVSSTSGGYEIVETNRVFEECFYEGLYPKISIEQAVSTLDSSVKAPALKMEIDVYSNGAMTEMAMAGDGYAQLINIDRNDINNTTDPKKQYIMHFQTVGSPVAGQETDTYIFYITRKTF